MAASPSTWMATAAAVLLAAVLLAATAGAVRGAADESPGAAFLAETGRTTAARLLGPRDSGEWEFELGGERRSLSPEKFGWWGGACEERHGPVLLLADDSRLAAEIYEIRGDRVIAGSRLLGDFEIPLAQVRGIAWQLGPAAEERDAVLRQIATARGRNDEVLLENGDRLTGLLGPLREFGETLPLETGAGRIDIPLDRLTAAIYNPALVQPPVTKEARTEIGLADGSLLYLEQWRVEGEELRLFLAGEVRFTLAEPAEFWRSVKHVRPLHAGVRFLTSLEPVDYRHVPYLTTTWPYGVNRSTLGGRLRAGGRLHPNGIGMHSTARLAYALPQGYARFAAELAVDDAAGGAGSVVFRVFLAGEGGWREAYRSPVVRGGEPPRGIVVELEGGTALALVVDFADRADERDYANWLYPRLLK